MNIPRRKKLVQARLVRLDGQPAEPARGWEGGHIKGVGRDIQAALVAFGYHTLDDLRAAPDEDLLLIPGIGGKLLAKIRAQLERAQLVPISGNGDARSR